MHPFLFVKSGGNMKVIIAAALLAVGLSGCAETRLTLPYSPTSTEELKGKVYVNDFSYHPQGNVAQDQIRNTAMGTILLTEPVGRFTADAVRREFRQSGLSLKADGNCYLDGEINDFALDDLGYSVTYITDFRYLLKTKPDNKILADTDKTVKFNSSKMVGASLIMANINKAVADNIAQLLIDPSFVKAVAASCQD